MTVYCKMLQILLHIITQCESYFITKRERSLLQNASGFLLQNVTFITNCKRILGYLHITIYVKKTFTKLLLIRKLIFCINSIFAMTNQRTLAHFELILLLGFLLSLLFRKELKNTESMKPVRTLVPNSLNHLHI